MYYKNKKMLGLINTLPSLPAGKSVGQLCLGSPVVLSPNHQQDNAHGDGKLQVGSQILKMLCKFLLEART